MPKSAYASHGRALHRMRSHPSHCQPTPLQQFDSLGQAVFSSPTGFTSPIRTSCQELKPCRTWASVPVPLIDLRYIWLRCTVLLLSEEFSAYVGTALVLAEAVTQATAATLNTRSHMLANVPAQLFTEGAWYVEFASASPRAKALLHSEGKEAGVWAFLAGVTHANVKYYFVIEFRHHLNMLETTGNKYFPLNTMTSVTLFFKHRYIHGRWGKILPHRYTFSFFVDGPFGGKVQQHLTNYNEIYTAVGVRHCHQSSPRRDRRHTARQAWPCASRFSSRISCSNKALVMSGGPALRRYWTRRPEGAGCCVGGDTPQNSCQDCIASESSSARGKESKSTCGGIQIVEVGRRSHAAAEKAGSHWGMAKRADLPGLDIIQRK